MSPTKTLVLVIVGFVAVFSVIIVTLVLPDIREDEKRERYCTEQLHGFLSYKGGYTYCVDSKWHILSDWDGLKRDAR
jgi:hypothetical protein